MALHHQKFDFKEICNEYFVVKAPHFLDLGCFIHGYSPVYHPCATY
jgi:hypothetical protein